MARVFSRTMNPLDRVAAMAIIIASDFFIFGSWGWSKIDLGAASTRGSYGWQDTFFIVWDGLLIAAWVRGDLLSKIHQGKVPKWT